MRMTKTTTTSHYTPQHITQFQTMHRMRMQ